MTKRKDFKESGSNFAMKWPGTGRPIQEKKTIRFLS